jgi:hypothetical protein
MTVISDQSSDDKVRLTKVSVRSRSIVSSALKLQRRIVDASKLIEANSYKRNLFMPNSNNHFFGVFGFPWAVGLVFMVLTEV